VKAREAAKKYSTAMGVMVTACALLVPSAYAQTATSLACNPSVITGGSGGSATCTVTLSAAAPSGGTVVTLTSSLIELAASVARVTVPAGQITASFTVATNANYRAYSGLAFSATISASANGTTQSATLNVPAQPRPPDFTSGSQAGSNTQWDGLMCGGIAPIGGRTEILYDCSPASGTGFGTCTFRQECSLGCRRVPPNGRTFNDFCATSGPNAVTLSRNYVVSGDRVSAAIVAEAPAGAAQDQEQGVPGVIDPNFNAIYFPQQGGIGFPTGASSVPFDVATSYVPSIEFADVKGFWFNASIPPFLITNGRGGHAWLVMLPPDPAPSVAMPTLGNFKITGNNPVTGGQSTIGQIDLSGLSRAGGPTVTITSSHPAIVPSMSVVSPASEQVFGYQAFIATEPPAADTDVTITATDGRYSFNTVLRVVAPPPPAVLSGVSVNPSSVVGGNPSTGTVTLSAPQSGATVVALSTTAPASVATMPASVTVPAGATSVTFTIATSPVSSTFNMNIFADLAGSPERQALLLITPGSAQTPTLSSLSLSPSSVVGGNSSTGTVTLSAAAPSGGATVSLSDNSSATTVPASVTVPPGATSANFTVTTTSVTASTSATISALFGGVTRTAALTLNPPAPPTPAAPTLVSPASAATPAQPVAFDWTDVANASTYEIQIDNTSTISAPFIASRTVTVSQATIGGLPGQQLWWRVLARNSAGVAGPFSSTRSFTPQGTSAPAALSVLSVNPASVISGNPSQGTVTLTAAAPSGGFVVMLADNSSATTVPASVTVPQGATSAAFAITTASVTASTPVTITASAGGITRTATLTVTPAGQLVTLTVTATGRSGERVISNPSGINVSVGSSGSASFAAGTTIVLSATNGRDVVWSGACSSGGNKTKSCTFTLNGNASVGANVQ
jgi:hypothetical protein